jgi:DNA-binding transcriptional ArsR family regulator
VNSDLANPAEINRLIHEPARLLIMANLRVVDSADFTFLMNRTGLTWGNLSSHLSKLEDAGYVSVDKTYLGKRPYTLLSLSEDGRVAFDAYTNQMHTLLANFL